MLAPRKTLWSTPDSVIQRVIDCVDLHSRDKVCDIGCGDARVLLQWATVYSQRISTCEAEEVQHQCFPEFLGIDVDPDRIEQANQKLRSAQATQLIDPRIRITFFCGNALDCPELLQNVTVYYLYLIPRGLRNINPLLLERF